MEWLDTVPLTKKDDEWFDDLKQMELDLLQLAALQGIPILREQIKEPEIEPLSDYIRTFTPRP